MELRAEKLAKRQKRGANHISVLRFRAVTSRLQIAEAKKSENRAYRKNLRKYRNIL